VSQNDGAHVCWKGGEGTVRWEYEAQGNLRQDSEFVWVVMAGPDTRASSSMALLVGQVVKGQIPCCLSPIYRKWRMKTHLLI
jgi:hypothetical protein